MGTPRLQGPSIARPSVDNAVIFPARFRDLPTSTGYQDAHRHYVEFKNMLINQAQGFGTSAAVVTIKFLMKSMIPGKKNPVIVSVSLFDIANNISE
jgi:hypothetical protein